MVPSSQPNPDIPDPRAGNDSAPTPPEAFADDLQAMGIEDDALSAEAIANDSPQVEAEGDYLFEEARAGNLPEATIEGDYPFEEGVAYEFPATQMESEPELEELTSDGEQDLELDPEKLDWEAQKAKALKAKAPGVRSQGLSLKTKATALALALSMVPVLAIGSGAYIFASRVLNQQAIRNQRSGAGAVEDNLEIFIQRKYLDIQALAEADTFTNPKVSQAISPAEKVAFLNRYIKSHESYDRILVADLNGNIWAQSESDSPLSPNDLKNSPFMQRVIDTQKVVIGQPYRSKLTGKLSLEIAAPVREETTGKAIAIVRMRTNLESLKEVFEELLEQEKEAWVFDDKQQIFLSTDEKSFGQNLKEKFPRFAGQIQAQGKSGLTIIEQNQHDNKEELINYVPAKALVAEPYNLKWGIAIGTPTGVAFNAQRQLLLSMLLGTGLTALAVGAIAAYLANRATRPLVEATEAVQKLGQGEFDTVIPVKSDDEIGVLAANINQMSLQMKQLLSQQQIETDRSQLLKEITLKLSQFPQVEQILGTAVEEMRFALGADRVIVYKFDENWIGNIIAESVADGWPRALGARINDPCFRQDYVEQYRQGRVQATVNIYEAGLTECHLQQLEPFAVKANLVAPIVVGSNRQLLGLLIAHQCSAPRQWESKEIDIFTQLATQVGFALDRVNLLEQQKSEKEKLQRRALELLMQVDPVSQGDLTIRAQVTEDEIGTIADSYNATIGSLRKIVTQVQAAAKKMAATTSSNEASVRELSAEALQQTNEITAALDRIQEMTNSIQAVARSAAEAEAAVQEATATVAAGDEAINRTVDGILAIRKTVSTTAKKVQLLGEASQKISKVVSLINSFADQTNLLALNAAIEAARAGEEGRGFAVVADEVGVLARQSSEATAEIESIVQEIQAETKELVAAMESGSKQVVEGTKLAQETRISLSKITKVSDQISELVKGIAQAAEAQSHASQVVAKTMSDVAAISTKTSDETTQVSESFKELLAVANELQASASQFKVN